MSSFLSALSVALFKNDSEEILCVDNLKTSCSIQCVAFTLWVSWELLFGVGRCDMQSKANYLDAKNNNFSNISNRGL